MATQFADPAWGAKTYQPRAMSWHMTLCDKHGVSVTRERAPSTPEHTGWWRAVVYADDGTVLYSTGGRTRRHAETNALNGIGAPMEPPRDDGLWFDNLFGSGPA